MHRTALGRAFRFKEVIMAKGFIMAAIALASIATTAQAQDDAPASIGGLHVGVEGSRTIGSASGTAGAVGTTERKSRGGFGYRGFAGYDVALGDTAIVGIEAGIGGGGRTVTQSGTAGQFSVDPRLNYDVTGRLGIAPAPGFLLYARAGYRWLQNDRTRLASTVGATRVTARQTDGGLTFGLGAEINVMPGFAIRAEAGRTRYDKDFRQDRIAIGALVKF
jgi:outer membrane immunogenic protein